MRIASLVALGTLAVTGCVEPEDAMPSEDPTGLPACASPQMQSIFKATRPYLPKGSVSDELAVTSHNDADAQLLLDGPEIFPAFHALIANAKREVDLQTYVWEANTDPTQEIVAGLA